MNRTGGPCKVLFCDEIRAFSGAPLSNGRINALVCMFNRFALAKPLCHRMKIAALGSSVRRAIWRRGAGAVIARTDSGDIETDGVDRPLHVSRHDGRVLDYPCQL